MPGHNGLFARQFPIASTYFGYLDISGFNRRRFDLFAIKQLALAIVVEDLLVDPVSADRVVRIVISFITQHGPGHACGLVGQGDSGHIRVAPLRNAGDPAAEPVIFVFGL